MCSMSMGRRNALISMHENTHNGFTAVQAMPYFSWKVILAAVGTVECCLFSSCFHLLLSSIVYYCSCHNLTRPWLAAPCVVVSCPVLRCVLSRFLWSESSPTVCGRPVSCSGLYPSYSYRGSPTSTSSLSKWPGMRYIPSSRLYQLSSALCKTKQNINVTRSVW